MTDLEYEVLSWLAAGNSVFRPPEATREGEEVFRLVVDLLARLRASGLVDSLESHITKTAGGIYPMVGPVMVTDAGKAALERDRSLGPRVPRSPEPLPWRP